MDGRTEGRTDGGTDGRTDGYAGGQMGKIVVVIIIITIIIIIIAGQTGSLLRHTGQDRILQRTGETEEHVSVDLGRVLQLVRGVRTYVPDHGDIS